MKVEISECALKHLRKRATILQFQNVPRSRFEGQVIADTLKALGLWEHWGFGKQKKEKP